MIQFAPADAPRTDAPPPVMSLEDIQTRRKLAEEMLRHGMDASPVQHWTQGLARVAQALSGRMSMDQAAGESRGLQKDANDTLLNLYKPSVTGAPMPAPPAAALTKTMAEAPLSDDQQGVANFASGMGTQGLAQAMPGKVATALDPSLVGAVKNFEGYAPKASWDYKQSSNGYGTRATAPGETIDRDTAEQRLNAELGKAQGLVGAFAPNAPDGFKKALTSLTYNAGPKWMDSGLGQAVQQGDWQKASELFQQYNKAGGQTNQGLVNRRQQEAQLWLNPAMATGGPQTNGQQAQPQTPQAPQQPTQVADASQGQGMTRETLSRMLANPLTRDAAQKFIIEHADPKKAEAQFGVVREGLEGKTYGWHNDKDQTIREYGGPPQATGPNQEKTGIQYIVQAIKEGKQSPELTNLYRKGPAVREELAKQGVDHASLLLQYASAKRQVAALNSNQMVKFEGTARSVIRTIDEVKSLAKEMDLSGLTQYNAARLNILRNTMGNTEQGQLAARYVNAVNTLKEEFATAATGGYAPTESAWHLANAQINGDYGVKQLNASLDEIQRLIRYRLEAIPNRDKLGPGAGNRYIPGSGPDNGQSPSAQPPASNPQSKIHDLGDGVTMEVH